MNLLERITIESGKCGGRPCIREPFALRHPATSVPNSKGILYYPKKQN